MVNERRWLILIFALYILLAIGYSLLMPLWEAPDEGAHYHLAWYLHYAKTYATPEKNYEAQQPRAFYYLGSWILRAIDKINPALTIYYFPREYKYNIRIPERRFDWADENYRFLLGVYALRWLNIIFGGVALWLNWKTFKLMAPEKVTLCLAALALAALIPQYLHIMSSVNNDALGTLAGALLFYLVVRFLKEPSNLLGLLLVGLAILLPLSTKLTVLPISVALLVLLAWKWFLGFSQKRWIFYSGLLVLLCTGILYFLFPEIVQFAGSEIKWRLFSLRKNALTIKYIKDISGQIIWTFWGKVGWLAVGLPSWIIYLLTTLGLTGMALQMGRLIKSKVDRLQFNIWLATWLIAIFTILAVIRNGLTTFATQGRFLFPAIGALSLLMVAGWYDVLPGRVQRYLPALIVLFFFSCNMILWLTGVIPVYYQPFLD
jgi:dolichyl-phosphate-mannose-protein mannosyltransferase